MKSREEKAFIEAFEAHADALFRHAFFRVSDREKAYDLTQDTYLKAWDYIVQGGEVKHYKSFLYRILHNLIIDSYRKKSSRSLDELLENEATAATTEGLLSEGSVRETEERMDEKMLIFKIRERIPELPEQYRDVLTFRFIDGLGTGEIAERVGVSENVVSVRIHRGIAKLKTLCDTYL
ncbi:MAG: RNA polymerase sigma factor [Parcubacteria group bacterium GW2011_GWA2_47_7]|nr:MAG: RNA polymerase sigma factor [Parcubacteria group bacterium GW2011_GWA2_47_7]